MTSQPAPRLWTSLLGWWSAQREQKGAVSTSALLVRELWGFLRDSTPERRRQRYGDMDFDWEYRVNTTSGTVGWRERLLGVFHSPYQPTDGALFHEMMASLPIDFTEFTFVDLGSGKGRTLLMASGYAFRRIVGVEVMPELHRAAEENIRAYKSCLRIAAMCADARAYCFPAEPMVLYLFNPLPEAGLRKVIRNLERSLQEKPRPVWVVYGNAILEAILDGSGFLTQIARTEQYVVYKGKI